MTKVNSDDYLSLVLLFQILLQHDFYIFNNKKFQLEHACHDTMQGYEEEFDYIMDANIAAAQGLSRQYMHNNRLETCSQPRVLFQIWLLQFYK